MWKTFGLLFLSNIFMTFAWYAHLLEYCIMVPAMNFFRAAMCMVREAWFMFRK